MCIFRRSFGDFSEGVQTLFGPEVHKKNPMKHISHSCPKYLHPCAKDICKRDLKALGMDLNRWETLTSERSAWRQAVHHGLSQFEETLVQQAEAKRQSQKQQNQGAGQRTDCVCLQCGRVCHSRIGLLSHTRCCSKSSIQSTLP